MHHASCIPHSHFRRWSDTHNTNTHSHHAAPPSLHARLFVHSLRELFTLASSQASLFTNDLSHRLCSHRLCSHRLSSLRAPPPSSPSSTHAIYLALTPLYFPLLFTLATSHSLDASPSLPSSLRMGVLIMENDHMTTPHAVRCECCCASVRGTTDSDVLIVLPVWIIDCMTSACADKDRASRVSYFALLCRNEVLLVGRICHSRSTASTVVGQQYQL